MFKENLDAVTRLVGTPISFLAEISLQFKKLDSLFGNKYKQAVEKNDKIIAYLQNEISRHKQTIDYENEPRDFIDAYLQEMKRREKMNNLEEFTEKQLTIAAYDFFAAGLDTTATTCRAFILYILYYPEVQSKIHEEMDNIIGKEHIITTSDQVRLPYLTAAMQELQRVAVLMPMNIHHIVLEDVQMGKNKVPKGTIVIPQFQSVHQDPDIYPGKMPTIKYTTGLIRAPEPFKCRAIPRN
uniref:Cytochrome P450 n=1 Tax=Acrobeloides nanus TaxID=290746 RepID=A0A914CKH5_9BILA